jgi:cytidylate kinase
MSKLLGVYIDGETKTGKGAASKVIASVLTDKGLHVHYDVAGDFYRRYVAHVRKYLGLNEADTLPTGPELDEAAQVVHKKRLAFENDDSIGDLQRPAIGKSVSVMAELPRVQQAGSEWWAITARRAEKEGADVIVIDGRNPRLRMDEASKNSGVEVQTALNLYMTCEPKEAARRTLLGIGVNSPTEDQIEAERVNVVSRRERDRQRAENPFIVPVVSVPIMPKVMAIDAVIKQSWHKQPNESELPTTVTLDNTHISKQDMLASVSLLACAAVDYAKQLA